MQSHTIPVYSETMPDASGSPFPPPPPPDGPRLPVLIAGLQQSVWLSDGGEIEYLGRSELRERLTHWKPLLIHRPHLARRLGLADLAGSDILELFAFVRPARPCLPSAAGLAACLGMAAPRSLEEQALCLLRAVPRLLAEIDTEDRRARRQARVLAAAGWAWGPAVEAIFDGADRTGQPAPKPAGDPRGALDIWTELDEWEDEAPPPPPAHHPVEPGEARRRLAQMVSAPGRSDRAEARPQQADYASAVSAAFAPPLAPAPPDAATPHIVLAEAGTGVGKTLGYLAPATLWAERNEAPVWVSTFTRNLQSQVERELRALYPDAALRRLRVVVRKGRENYLCLLNLEEAAQHARTQPQRVVALTLMARWARASRDGALVGGDLPGWLPELLGQTDTLGLGDRRGECIYSACTHYRRCFIEHTVRRARRASIVIANHALVMTQAASGAGAAGLGHRGLEDGYLPTRYVFDEGHHLFDAADGAFSAHFTGASTADLRRWLLGAEGGLGRSRGLRRRIQDLVATEDDAIAALQALLIAAAVLPGEGWLARIAGGPEGGATGPVERFLSLVRQQVLARARATDPNHALEAELQPLPEALTGAATVCSAALGRMIAPLERLAKALDATLDREAGELDSAQRMRIAAVLRSLERRALLPLQTWTRMLRWLVEPKTGDTADRFVDWASVARNDGRERDVGLHRHWIDPTIPFAAAVAAPSHGLIITSATLADSSGDFERDWQRAEALSGAAHLPGSVMRMSTASPFDYVGQTRSFVVTDVARDDLDQVAAAYRELFLAAGGGALGLFTAIQRLRAVHRRIASPLDAGGLSLYAQHVDGPDVGTLIDLFRGEPDSCLLGTDAIRDGVDVPGDSLRLIVFDRVPWPRPDILHKARRRVFGGKDYDDFRARMRLRQGFGRLIRTARDRGVFVMLDAMTPSRLLGAFPEGAQPTRVGLAEAVAAIRAFLPKS